MRISRSIHRTLLAALLASPAGVSAQSTVAPEPSAVDPYFVESSAITSDTGPRVITRNVLQDRSGDYWLATWNGIVRYDGRMFTNVTNQQGLRRYRVFSLLEDREGHIWIGTTGAGVFRYDGAAYANFTSEDGLVDDVVLSMMQDRDGDIWFGGMGLTKYDGAAFTTFTAEDGFTSSDVHSIAQSPEGDMWFGTRGALFRYDGETFVNFTEQHQVSIDQNSYTPVLIDRRGHVWFGGSTGLYHYDGAQLRRLFEPASFSLMEDSRGRIWFSGGSVKGEDPQPGISVLNRFDPADGLDNILDAREQIVVRTPAVFGMSEDRDGDIWFGGGRGVGRIQGDAVQFFAHARREPAAVDRRVLDAYVGRYQDAAGEIMTIGVDGGRLVAEAGGRQIRLAAESSTRFRAPDDDSAITFFSAATGRNGLWADQSVWRKLSESPAGAPDDAISVDARSAVDGLVFRNTSSWGRRTDFETVLDMLGGRCEKRTSDVMANLDLSPFDVMIIPGAQDEAFYDDYLRHAERLDDFVANGGVLVLELNGAEGASIVLPRGVTMASGGAVENAILAPDHPIFLPLAGERRIRANYASHGHLRGVPSDARILAVEVDGDRMRTDRPTIVEYAHGEGRVIAACQCLHDQDGSGRGPLMEAVISYALARSWAAEN